MPVMVLATTAWGFQAVGAASANPGSSSAPDNPPGIQPPQRSRALQGMYVPVSQKVWALAGANWQQSQKDDGSRAYTPNLSNTTASMTCAGVSSLIVSGLHRDKEIFDHRAVAGNGESLML
jgi:hypothetical protein